MYTMYSAPAEVVFVIVFNMQSFLLLQDQATIAVAGFIFGMHHAFDDKTDKLYTKN